MVDPIEFLRAVLLADGGIIGQVGARIWGEMVPANETESMPQKSICIISDGIPTNPSLPVIEFRVAIHCFGPEPGFVAAWEVARAVYDCLKRGGTAMQAVTGGQVYYYMANCTCPGRPVNEPVTNWPRVNSEWVVTLSENLA